LDAAVAALRSGRPAEAERLAVRLLRSNPRDLGAAQILGNALLMQNRPGDAAEALRPAARRSGDPSIETLLARALAAAGRTDEALAQLRQTTARHPAYVLAVIELGDLLGRTGRLDEAVAALAAGVAANPDAPLPRIALGYLHLRRNDRAGARAQFSAACAAAPQRHDALVALAKVTALDGDFAAAAALHRRALALRPDDVATRINLGKCLLDLGDRETGEAALRAAIRAVPQATGLAITTLAAAAHGRAFLRPSDAARFLNAGPV